MVLLGAHHEDLGRGALGRSVTSSYLHRTQLLLPGEVQANPDKGEKPRSEHQVSSFISAALQVVMHRIVCLFAPGAFSSRVCDYVLLFWPWLETASGCVCSGSFRVRNSKRGTVSSVVGRKASANSVITTDSVMGLLAPCMGMHKYGEEQGKE